jgi:benzoate membrane transport protein
VSINLSVPVLIFLAGAGSGFTLPQILGANLVVGLAAIVFSVFRLSHLLEKIVPTHVAIAVFAGGIVAFMVKTAGIAVDDPMIVGAVGVGYLAGLAITRNHLLATIIAAPAGFMAATWDSGVPSIEGAVRLPEVGIPAMQFDASAIVALGIPLLILTVGVGNLQALALLRTEGFRPRSTYLGALAGIATVVNALGGGHAAAIGGSSAAIAASPAAGPSTARYWAIVVSSIPTILVALAAVPVIAIVQDLPLSFTLLIGALAIASPFVRVFRASFAGPSRAGVTVAFLLAMLPFEMLGLPMAFWALVGGSVVARLIEWFGAAEGLHLRLTTGHNAG